MKQNSRRKQKNAFHRLFFVKKQSTLHLIGKRSIYLNKNIFFA